jgi:hypothetical protein
MDINKIYKLAYDMTSENIGMYPQSWKKGNDPEVKRTEWQNGWNACAIKFSELMSTCLKFFLNLKDDNFIFLLEADVGWVKFDEKENKFIFILNMNDQFDWGCADAEKTEEKDYPELVRLYKLYGDRGLLYWVSEKRGYDPDKEASEGHEINWKAVQEIRAKETRKTSYL